MIKTQNLSKYFDKFLAVDNVSLDVGPGQVLALLGPNGAGKTTTIRILTSILAPSKGWAQVAGFDVQKESQKVRASVGGLTENHGLYNQMPAEDYLNFFGQVYSIEESVRQKSINNLLELFSLGDVRRKRIGEYSKGMRQKLALARALLHNPPVLLLDEPTSAMDPESARLVRDAINKLRSDERTIMICTHNLVEAEELADQIAIIRRGKIIAQGPPQEMKTYILGPPEYELRLTKPLNGIPVSLPEGVALVSSGPDWIRYQTEDPIQVNPIILQNCIHEGLPVLSLQEVQRSLEQVYLQAINNTGEESAR